MFRFASILLSALIIGFVVCSAYAQDVYENETAVTAPTETAASEAAPTEKPKAEDKEVFKELDAFSQDMTKIRDILVESAGNRPLLRGMMLPLFQPMFLAIMFCFGLWASQISDRVPIIWSVPAALFLSVVAAAFISAFHQEWKPDLTFGDSKYLPDLTDVQITTMLCAIAIGAMVAFNKSISPIGDIAFASAVGLVSGFSQTSINTDGNHDTLMFWVGFGMTAVLLNIIGIGFETFLKSMKLSRLVQFFGVLSVGLGFMLAVQVF